MSRLDRARDELNNTPWWRWIKRQEAGARYKSELLRAALNEIKEEGRKKTMQFLVIAAGCAECRGWDDESILSIHGPFATLDEAKASGATKPDHLEQWTEHEQGGWFLTTPSSEDWIIPVPDDLDLSFIKPWGTNEPSALVWSPDTPS